MLTPLQILKPAPDNPLRARPLVRPFGQVGNPIRDGVQMGIVGAAAGVGVAGIQRALRLRAGNTTPVAVYRPMAIGALIGTALGTLGAYKSQKQLEASQPYPPPETWEDLGGNLERTADPSIGNKYAGLRHITKTAGLGWDIASIPLSVVPGVGTALALGDMAGNAGRGVSNLAKGNLRGAAGEGLGMLGNAGLGLLGLLPGGGLLRGAAKGAKSINYATRAAQGIKGVQAGNKATGRLAGLWNRMAPLTKRVPGKAITGLERFGSKVQPFNKHTGKLFLGGMAANVAGGNMASALPRGSNAQRYSELAHTTRPGLRAASSDTTLFGPQAMPQFEVPNVQY